MLFKKLIHLLVITLLFLSQSASSAVILQYHHVSEKLPSITSISAQDFYAHMAYLQASSFHVIPLDVLLKKLKSNEPLPHKTVAITFDDGYKNNIQQAAPILEAFDYPYTVFVNPKLIDEKKQYVMTWSQLKDLAVKGALIANHSAKHDYLHHKIKSETDTQWLSRIEQDILWSEQRIKDEVGHNARILAYPYGEFNKPLQALVDKLKFTGVGQHSGAVGQTTIMTRVPRFPASGVYSELKTLKTKLNTLPFNIYKLDYQDSVTVNRTPDITIHFNDKDFNIAQFTCFVSGAGRGEVNWVSNKAVNVTSLKPLAKGRSRFNCTAPSIKYKGQFYWFSQPWVIK